MSAAYGIVDEVHQYFVPGRQLSVWDMLSDVFGSVTAVMFMAWLMSGRRRHAWLALLFVLLGASTSLVGTLLDS